MTGRQTGFGFVLCGAVVALSACSSSAEDVASLDGAATGMVDGYANAATAQYAECLEAREIAVFPTKAAQQPGYLEIVGGQFLPDEDGSVTEENPIGVDGVDHQTDIDECRRANPGYRDIYTRYDDDLIVPEGGSRMQQQIAAGREWAQCARDAGFPMIEDPLDGSVMIPAEITLEQAVVLGQTCSHPVESLDDPIATFGFEGGEYDPELDAWDSTALSQAIEGPITANLDLAEESDASSTS